MNSRKLTGSPASYRITSNSLLDFLIINIGGACNQSCTFCWTSASSNKSFESDRLTVNELDILIDSFKKCGGKSIAIMSDGEPLFSENLEVTESIAMLSGKYELHFLLFTNAQLLSSELIDKLLTLNRRISFVISINALENKSYSKTHGIKSKSVLPLVLSNIRELKTKLEQTQRRTECPPPHTQMALHFVLTQATLEEVSSLDKLANDMECPLFITTLGAGGRAVINKNKLFNLPQEDKLVHYIEQTFSRTIRPTAQSDNGKCSYISYSENLNELNGITIHSQGGVLQACPYFVGLGFVDWFSLKRYLSLGEEDIKHWLYMSVKISALVVDKIFEVFGPHYCLMRHPRHSEIESFVRALNQ